MKKPGKASCLSEVNENLMRMFSHIAQDNSGNISKKYRLSITRCSDNKLYVDISDEKNRRFHININQQTWKEF